MKNDLPCKQKTNKQKEQKSLFVYQIKQALTIRKDKEGHHIMIKGSIQQEHLIIMNTYAPNTIKHPDS